MIIITTQMVFDANKCALMHSSFPNADSIGHPFLHILSGIWSSNGAMTRKSSRNPGRAISSDSIPHVHVDTAGYEWTRLCGLEPNQCTLPTDPEWKSFWCTLTRWGSGFGSGFGTSVPMVSGSSSNAIYLVPKHRRVLPIVNTEQMSVNCKFWTTININWTNIGHCDVVCPKI